MIQDISRDVPTAGQMKKEAEALEEMAYHIAAMAEVAKFYGPKKDKGPASKKNWNMWTNDMSEGALALAKAAAAKGAQEERVRTSQPESCPQRVESQRGQ